MARLDTERLAAWRSFHDAHAAITNLIAAELDGERELPLVWYDVLAELNEAGGRMRMQQLAARLQVNKSSLSRQVDRLVDAGLVAREPCPDDGRGWFASVTRDGRETWRRAQNVYQRAVQRGFAGHLTDSDVAALARVFAKLPGVVDRA
jgi:DNA-binding MarR family transcriptional regulator